MGVIFKKMAILWGIITVSSFVFSGIVVSTANIKKVDDGQAQVQRDEEERTATETKKEIVPFDTETIDDNTIKYGETVVKTEGVNGEKAYTYSVAYKGKKETLRKLIKEEITKQPVTKIIARGTKVVWHCVDATSYNRNPYDDNKCTSSTGEQRYVDDCTAVALDPDYHPSQRGASRYNGCPNY